MVVIECIAIYILVGICVVKFGDWWFCFDTAEQPKIIDATVFFWPVPAILVLASMVFYSLEWMERFFWKVVDFFKRK